MRRGNAEIAVREILPRCSLNNHQLSRLSINQFDVILDVFPSGGIRGMRGWTKHRRQRTRGQQEDWDKEKDTIKINERDSVKRGKRREDGIGEPMWLKRHGEREKRERETEREVDEE